MTRMEGASDSSVSSAIIRITRSVNPLPCPKLTLISCAARRRREEHKRHDFPGGRPSKLAISSSRLS
jgi:hypothetical protein